MARLAFSCVPWSIGSSSESAPLVEGSAESGEQPVLTRLATSGVRAEFTPVECALPVQARCGDRHCGRSASSCCSHLS